MKKTTEIYRKAKKGTTCMLAETFPRIYCIEAHIWLPSNMQTFFYRRPLGYALDPLKIRTLRCSVHTEPPLKDPCEHSENIEQSRVNEVSDGRFFRCCVSVAQESESLEHSILNIKINYITSWLVSAYDFYPQKTSFVQSDAANDDFALVKVRRSLR